MTPTCRLRLLAISAIAVMGMCLSDPLGAQAPGPRPRIYILDCGRILNRDPGRYSLTKEEVPSLTMAASCFLIVHGQATLLYDTGLGDDGNNPSLQPDFVPGLKSLKAQLTEIGHPPETITYLAFSHHHGDHTGNANDYRTATWLVPRREFAVMFPEVPPANYNNYTYRMLKDAKTLLLDGDHDVFGDGSVVLKSTPGHTPGHQSLFVSLAQTGPVVIAGDLYHWSQQRTMNRLPKNDYDLGQTVASRKLLDEFVKKLGAQVWVTHDSTEMDARKHAPGYYD